MAYIAAALMLALSTTVSPHAGRATTLTVFAAASLHRVLPALGERFARSHPGLALRYDFDGSQILEAQLENGAHADVFASADEFSMRRAVRAGLVETPARLAANEMVVIASRSAGVRRIADLANAGVKIDLCGETVPCGRYSAVAMSRLAGDRQFPPEFVTRLQRNIVSREQNVEAAVAKVSLGEADAGFVYATDATGPAAGRLRVLRFSPRDRVVAAYPIAVVRNSATRDLARGFVAYVRSADGRKMLQSFGFVVSR
ncbi:MAG: molybdate ABC transporter substrate-binding protein [Candidatus Eremiobacteraeota bacterium]|nr:molybdate ABC transporter substrate-binding protein [Candidatus Eremiobacteraeota bacterium]